MERPLLSIVIPTRNRLLELSATLQNLTLLLADYPTVEILVSDNSDIALSSEFDHPRIRFIRPKVVLQTAEENLFFALRQARGVYVWPLGDDDVVLSSGLKRLIEECESGRLDAFTMNTRNVTHDYRPMGWSRVQCFHEEIQIPYQEFLERIGYWSIPAGISLTVFKGDLISEKSLSLVMNLKSKIYSHVTFYGLIFNRKKFAFLNVDIVEYRTNLYDVSHSTTDHWTSNTSRLKVHDRYFWLNGFLDHLILLEENNAINSDYLSRAIDIGHFNHRLPLLEHMFGMFVDQILFDVQNLSKIPISDIEVKEILQYFQRKEPSYIGYYQEIRLILFGDKDLEAKIESLMEIREKWNIERTSYPYRRFYRSRQHGFFIFETPLGWLALPPKGSGLNNGVPGIQNLGDMLLGIDFPNVNGIETGTSKEELFEKIRANQMSRESLQEMSGFQLIPIHYKTNELQKEPTNLVRRIWNNLPLRLKIFLRKSMYGR
jgi:hypothetical protein